MSPQALSGFFIVAVILAAFVLAFVVDLLKGNVDQLREVAIDLKARKEAAETHIRSLELILTHQHQPMAAMATAGIAPPVTERAMLPEGLRDGRPESLVPATITAKQPIPVPVAAAPQQQQQQNPERQVEKPVRRMSPAVAAVAESVAARMANNTFRPAVPVEADTEDAAAAVAATPIPVPVVAGKVAVPVSSSSNRAPGEKTTLRIPIVEPVPPSLEASKKNWNQILSAHKGSSNSLPGSGNTRGNTGIEFPAAAASAAGSTSVNTHSGNVIEFRGNEAASLPAGLYDYSLLQKAAGEGKTFNGLVVSIGLNAFDSQHTGIVHGFLGSLMDATDFACWSDAEQFLLVCSDLSGDAAQRRLARITEKLWDFQLRSMGTLNIQFAWGGKEGRAADRLNDVVAAAIEQMCETRDARRNRMPAASASSTQSAKIAQAV